MPALPFKRISQSGPRTCLTCGSDARQPHRFDELCNLDEPGAHINRQGRELGIGGLVQGLDRPGDDGLYQIWYRAALFSSLASNLRDHANWAPAVRDTREGVRDCGDAAIVPQPGATPVSLR
jgi:hypothetical protein